MNAKARHPFVSRGEAQAIAAKLGAAPENLRAIKMHYSDGSTHFTAEEPPELPGYQRQGMTLDYGDRRAAVRYESQDGTLIIVAHETGAAIWTAVDQVATVVGLLGGVTTLIDWVRRSTGGHRRDPDRVTVDADGDNTSDVWDGTTI